LTESTLHIGQESIGLDSRNHKRRALIILSIVLHTQVVSAIGRIFGGSEWSLPGLGIGMTLASFQIDGNPPVSKCHSLMVKEFGVPIPEDVWKVSCGCRRGHMQ
jgi:hypothetical protein